MSYRPDGAVHPMWHALPGLRYAPSWAIFAASRWEANLPQGFTRGYFRSLPTGGATPVELLQRQKKQFSRTMRVHEFPFCGDVDLP